MVDRTRLTWVEALEGVQSGGGGQLEGQRGQGVLLTKDARLALADCQDLGVLVQGQVGVDGQGRDRRRLLTLRLLLLLEALRLRLACKSPETASAHISNNTAAVRQHPTAWYDLPLGQPSYRQASWAP